MAEQAAGTPGWRAVLRERGQRLTPQRELVLAAVDRLGHGTPEEVHAEVSREAPAVNISTVYRNLALLEELGVVRVVHLGERIPTYHSLTLPAHVHLTCVVCQRVLDADPGEFAGLAAELAREHDFELDVGRLVLPGRCTNCREDAHRAHPTEVSG